MTKLCCSKLRVWAKKRLLRVQFDQRLVGALLDRARRRLTHCIYECTCRRAQFSPNFTSNVNHVAVHVRKEIGKRMIEKNRRNKKSIYGKAPRCLLTASFSTESRFYTARHKQLVIRGFSPDDQFARHLVQPDNAHSGLLISIHAHRWQRFRQKLNKRKNHATSFCICRSCSHDLRNGFCR